jgi:membrane-associated protease RseP (regulator of RpoE activity)
MTQSMSRSTTPLLVSVGLALAASASPLVAQKSETGARTLRVSSGDSSTGRLRRLERSIDSLVRVYHDDELTAEQRFKLRQQIDARFSEFVALREAATPRASEGNVFIRRGPDVGFETRFGQESSLLPRIAPTAMVSGWIGIVVSGAPTQIRVEGNEMLLRYLIYPEIASVDPSSPAQRAGLTPGDTLMAYNGRDVRTEEISMTRLLVPKATVKVRVRRDGKVKELPVVVADAPARIKERRQNEMRDGPTWVAVTPMPPRVPGGPLPPPSVYTPAPARAPFGASPVVAPLPPVFNLSGIAGAQVVTVSETMQRSTALPAGVLVTTVPVGSPAAESGLEEGDVITRVGQQPITTVRELRELVARAAEEGESSVTIELRRGKDRRTLTLRWRSN